MTDKTINEYFEGLRDNFNYSSHTKLILKLRNKLESLGIKQMKYKKPIKSTDVFTELTLIVYPHIPNDETEFFTSSYQSEGSTIYEKLKEMTNFTHNTLYYNQYFNNEGTPINLKIENDEVEIGLYIKNKNLLVLYHSFFAFFQWKNSNKEEDNPILYLFLNALSEFVIKNRVKTEDLSQVIKNRAIELFKSEVNKEIMENTKQIKNTENEIETYNNYLKNKYFEREAKKRSNETLKIVIKDLYKNIVKQIKEIKTLPFVKSVRLLIKGLKIDVGSIKIKDVYIGDFVIYLTPRNIKIENTNPQDRDKNKTHPHINNDGSICFGNRKDLVYQMLAKYEYKKLVYFLYLYLKSYNKDDNYNSITYWTGEDEEPEEHENETFCDECNNYVNDDDYNDDENMCYSCWEARD